MKRKVTVTAVVLLIILMIFTFVSRSIYDYNLPRVSAVKVTTGSITLAADATGTLDYQGASDLKAAGAWTIGDVKVKDGQKVSEGDILCAFDTLASDINIQTLELNVLKAQNALDALNQKKQDVAATNAAIIKSERDTIASLQETLSAPFDDYAYQQAITVAKTALTRKQADLADAQSALTDAAQSEPSASVVLTVQRREQDLQSAKETLIKAQMNLKETQDDAGTPFDAYPYQTALDIAQTNLTRKQQDCKDAETTLAAAQNTLNNGYFALYNVYFDADDPNAAYQAYMAAQTVVDAAQAAVDTAQKAVITASRNLQDAQTQFNQAKDALARAKAAYDQKQSDQKDSSVQTAQASVDAAQKAVTSAQQALQDAQLSEQNAQGTLSANVKTAQRAVMAAQQAVDDAQTSLDTANTSLARAQDAYNKSLNMTRSQLANEQAKLQSLQNSDGSSAGAKAEATATLNIAQAQLDLAVSHTPPSGGLVAPCDGAVFGLSLKPNDTVQPGNVIVTIIPDAAKPRLTFTLPTDAGATYGPGANVQATLETSTVNANGTHKRETVRGTITSGILNGDGWTCKAQLNDMAGRPVAGQDVQLEVSAKAPGDGEFGFIIPIGSLFGDGNGGKCVFTIDTRPGLFGLDSYVTQQSVTVVVDNGKSALVTGGVTAGQLLANTPSRPISTGTAVWIRDN